MEVKELNLPRFTKMMIIQYCRSVMLGYSENQSKAIGFAEALKYAIFKNRAFWGKKNKKSKKSQINFENNYKIDNIFKLYLNENNYPIVANKVITEKNFEMELFKKGIDNEIFSKIVKNYFNIISKVDSGILKNENKFFKEVWVKIRDKNPLELN